MNKIYIDFSKVTHNRIKPLHGVNRPDPQYDGKMNRLMDIGVPFVRLHDCGGAYGRSTLVDIPNIFRDFSADPNDPNSYDFAFTDAYLKTIVNSGMQIFFRLGVTIEGFHTIKAYRIYPPDDPQKWAIICEHIVRHYNEGWANGFHFDIKYWEIWNEPDNPDCWLGTKEDYFHLYRITANHLKQCFPEIKIGGYAGCGFYQITRKELNPLMTTLLAWFDAFLEYIKNPETMCALDFFSFHLYSTDPDEIGIHANYARKRLDDVGLCNTEIIVNEWNYVNLDSSRWNKGHVLKKEIQGAAFTAGNFCVMQNSPVDISIYYDAYPVSGYCGIFFFPSLMPTPAYYAFKAFNEVYQLQKEVKSHVTGDKLYACASTNSSGQAAAMIVNNSTEKRNIDIEISGSNITPSMYILDSEHSVLTLVNTESKTITLNGFSVLLLLYGKTLMPDTDIPDDTSICFSRLI